MRRREPLSIALRLALLFSAMAAAIFVGVGAYLYGTLASQMIQRDDGDLLNKVALLRHVLASEPSAVALRAEPGRVLGVVHGEGIVVRIDAADGSMLAQNRTLSSGWHARPVIPVGRNPRLADIFELETASGRVRAVSAAAATADGSPLRLAIARERSERLAVLKRYAGDLIAALLAGAALATLLGFLIIRHAMHPIHDVIGKANDISAHRLNSRLSVEDVPAELQGLGVAFNAMLDRLEEGVQRLSGFAADLAHDMRTPVNTLMVETQVALARTRSVEEYQALMASNLEEYERLARMIENTLFLARAENAQSRLERKTLDAHCELARIRDYFAGLAEEARVVLEMAPEETGATDVYAEPILFQRAISNLISNAIAHTPAGGTVSLAILPAHGGTAVRVANMGEGIPPDRLARIFDRYYRGDEARTGSGPSAGLGLSIVRAIMALHDGRVSAESRLGGPTTFTLYFPQQAKGGK